MAYMAYMLGNIEISEKKKRVYHLRRRNIEISEKKKHVEDLGHDVRHGYKHINIYIYRKIIAAVRLGGLAPARPMSRLTFARSAGAAGPKMTDVRYNIIYRQTEGALNS